MTELIIIVQLTLQVSKYHKSVIIQDMLVNDRYSYRPFIFSTRISSNMTAYILFRDMERRINQGILPIPSVIRFYGTHTCNFFDTRSKT
jgi:hypothetical protein